MAVTNKLVKQEQPKSLKITFKSGDEEVTLSPLVIRNYLVNGDAKNVTDQEVMMFMMLCKHQHLNPLPERGLSHQVRHQPCHDRHRQGGI